jgi:hypothetical protein
MRARPGAALSMLELRVPNGGGATALACVTVERQTGFRQNGIILAPAELWSSIFYMESGRIAARRKCSCKTGCALHS